MSRPAHLPEKKHHKKSQELFFCQQRLSYGWETLAAPLLPKEGNMDAHRSLTQPPNHWIENVHQVTSPFFSGVIYMKTIHFSIQLWSLLSSCSPQYISRVHFQWYLIAATILSPCWILIYPDIISYCQAFNGCYCSIKKWICQQNGAYPKHAVPVEVMKIKSVVFPVPVFHANPCIYFDFIIFHQPEIKPFGIGNDSLRVVRWYPIVFPS